jgi:multiple sugar transport system permease protein
MTRSGAKQTALLGALVSLLLLDLVPVFWGALVSIRQPIDAFAAPPRLLVMPTLEFHRVIWTQHGFVGFLLNSCLVAGFTLLISLPIGCLAGYGLARIEGRRATATMAVLLLMRSLPPMLLVIPYYALARTLHLVDTYAALVMPLVALNQPFVVWLMRAFFRDLPPELEEAALIDGATRLQAFRHVLLPAVRPGLAIATLFSLLFVYNEFTLALVLTGPHTRTLPVALAAEGGEDVAYWSLSAAAAIGVMVPGVLLAGLLVPVLKRQTGFMLKRQAKRPALAGDLSRPPA